MRGRLGEKGAREKEKEAGKVGKKGSKERVNQRVWECRMMRSRLLLADRKRGGWDLHSHQTLKMEEERQADIKERGIKDDAG